MTSEPRSPGLRRRVVLLGLIAAAAVASGAAAAPTADPRLASALERGGLDPGSVVAEHSHENEQLGLVIRGR
ncbi:MAG: hypothetical protein ACRDNY_06790 [Gaiellaceae bacterium]